MPSFVDAIARHPQVKFFRVLERNRKDPADWQLEPLMTELLSETNADDYHVIAALNVLPDATLQECYIDMALPERISDYAFFVSGDSLRFGYQHEFPGEFLPAAALDCAGLYELFYSRTQPQLGVDILGRGLAIAKRKHCIAEDLGYILRDEGRLREAAAAFELALEDGPSSYFIYGELAAAYRELGDDANATKYDEMFKREERADR